MSRTLHLWGAAAFAWLAGCGSQAESAPPAVDRDGAVGGARWRECATELGIASDTARAQFGDHFMPEIIGPGVALFDCDGDGDLDVYAIGGRRARPLAFDGVAGANRLWLQESNGVFRDASAASGLGDGGYGMGVAVGDVDNDGAPDVFVANFGRDALYLGNGDGTFRDATEAAGVGDERWSTSAGFFDYDGDGFLDLFVVHYLDFEPAENGDPDEYPGPTCCPGVGDSLYRNRGDGTFEDVSSSSGIAARPGRGLGVAFTDFDGDGLLDDVYVANDGEANAAWIRSEDGTWSDHAAELGVAVNMYGTPEAGMGVAVGDVDGDLDFDLFVTHLAQETNTLYENEGRWLYRDATIVRGLGKSSVDSTGFGTGFFDADLDGDLDLLAVNGRVQRAPVEFETNESEHWSRYAEPALFWENNGEGRFALAPESCGDLCSERYVARGLALGDLESDGDVDFVVVDASGRLRVYRHEGPRRGNYALLRLVERGRDALGAQVRVQAGGRTWLRASAPAGSYLSSHDPRVHLGLADVSEIERVDVTWADGAIERFGPLEVGRPHTLVRGEGRP